MAQSRVLLSVDKSGRYRNEAEMSERVYPGQGKTSQRVDWGRREVRVGSMASVCI